jgi:hypothetical protein
MIGGLAINRFDRLAAMVGADGCSADARAGSSEPAPPNSPPPSPSSM